MVYIRGAQPAAERLHAAVGDRLCGRACTFKVVPPSKKSLFSLQKQKKLNFNTNFDQDEKLLYSKFKALKLIKGLHFRMN